MHRVAAPHDFVGRILQPWTPQKQLLSFNGWFLPASSLNLFEEMRPGGEVVQLDTGSKLSRPDPQRVPNLQGCGDGADPLSWPCSARSLNEVHTEREVYQALDSQFPAGLLY